MSKVQSILFDKDFFTTKEARKWLKNNNFKPIKRVHKTKNYLRYRIRYPYKKYEYRIIDFESPFIKAVIMFN